MTLHPHLAERLQRLGRVLLAGLVLAAMVLASSGWARTYATCLASDMTMSSCCCKRAASQSRREHRPVAERLCCEDRATPGLPAARGADERAPTAVAEAVVPDRTLLPAPRAGRWRSTPAALVPPLRGRLGALLPRARLNALRPLRC